MEARNTFSRVAAVDLTAARYRAEGYDVLVDPTGDQLPASLQQFHPDLLARRGRENVVIGVKSRHDLAKDPEIRELARIVGGLADWRFDLLLITPDKLDEGLLSIPSWWDESQIRARFAEAGALMADHPEAAAVLTLAATEAALRLAARAEDAETKDYSLPYVLSFAATQGMIPRELYQPIQDLRDFRNALAHGISAPVPEPGTLLAIAAGIEALLDEIAAEQANHPEEEAA